ncbi:MAG: hypothetical protein WCF54_11005, partial [Terracidiphilus sp.]
VGSAAGAAAGWGVSSGVGRESWLISLVITGLLSFSHECVKYGAHGGHSLRIVEINAAMKRRIQAYL